MPSGTPVIHGVISAGGTFSEGIGGDAVAPVESLSSQTLDRFGQVIYEQLTEPLLQVIRFANESPVRFADSYSRALDFDTLGRMPVAPPPPAYVYTFNATVDTSAFATGDSILGTSAAGAIGVIPNAALYPGGVTTLQSLIVIDAAVQSAALEFWFFDTAQIAQPVSNAAFTITDPEALHVVGVVATGPYYASALNSVSVRSGIGLTLTTSAYNMPSPTATVTNRGANRDLFYMVVTRGAPTYAVNDLTFRMVFYPDAAPGV